jgi:hypothetical protein
MAELDVLQELGSCRSLVVVREAAGSVSSGILDVMSEPG